MGRFRSRHLVVLLLLLGASGSPTSAQTPEGSEVTLQGTKVAKGGSGVFGPSDIFRAPRGVCSENCESGKMSLVQSSVARRKAPGSALKPWDVRMYFVAEHHKSGTDLLNTVLRQVFWDLGSPRSCSRVPENAVTVNSVACDDDPSCTIQVHANPSPDTVQQVRATARSHHLDLRAVHAIRKPKDMLVSAYCYTKRGQEAGDRAFANFPWAEFLSNGPAQGMMILWNWEMHEQFSYMVDMFVSTTPLETFTMRYEEVTKSSADFDKIIQRLLGHFFDGLVSKAVLRELAEGAKLADLHRYPESDGAHTNDPDCMATANAALLSLDSEILEQLRAWQAQLGYSIENWPDPVIG